jgi:mannose-6-phosphate isomerase-like protein (cupin superfamily)
MDRTPKPLSLTDALALPVPLGRRSAEAFADGDIEFRIYAPRGLDAQEPHDRDEVYIVARGRGHFRAGDVVTAFEPGALLFAAAHEVHRFENFSDDLAVWVIFYGARK